MYTTGHEQILRDAVALFEDPKERTYFASAELSSAVSYPDFPCGGIEIEGDVMVDRLRRCGELELGAELLLSDKESMGYQSHYGFYSLWHSMTIDPNMSVSKVAKNVVEYVVICCKLAYERKSLFWLGFALHIVMDSYSPAHVLRVPRDGRFQGFTTRDLVAWIRTFDSDLTTEARTNIEEMRSLIRTVVESKESVQKTLASVPAKHRPTASFILFDHLQRKETFGPTPTRSDPARSDLAGSIMNFYYYPAQKGVFHNVHDLLSEVKKAGNYDPCVLDVHEILSLFTRSKSRSTFIKDLTHLLARSTYRLHPDCADSETGFDISSVLNPSRATLVFEREDGGGEGTKFVLKSRISSSKSRLAIEILDDVEGVFRLPMIKQDGSKYVVVYKTFKFAERKKASKESKTLLAYTFLKCGKELGFPLSIVWNGAEHTGAMFVA